MNGRTALGIGLACLAYVLTLIATLPAAWLPAAIGSLSKQSLQLRDVSGNAWKGSGRLYLRERAGGLLDLGELRWNASPAGLLAGKFVTDLVLGESAGSARVELSPASVTLRGVSLAFPGDVLAQIVPAMNPLGPQGTVLLRSENLRVSADELLGLADIEWRPVRLAAAHGLDLGSHVAHLRAGGRKIDFELGTIEGPLRLSGSGAWTQESGLAGSGMLEHGENQPALAAFLQGMCADYRARRCSFGARR